MATVYSNKGLDGSPAFFSDKGNLGCVVSEYTASSLAAGSAIRMCKVPAGATIVDGYVSCDDLGTGVVLDVGDATTANRFMDDLDAASAAVTAARFDRAIPYSYSDDAWLFITTSGGTASGSIKLVVFYVME